MNKPSCSTCRYWHKLSEHVGECRASTPQIVFGMLNGVSDAPPEKPDAVWPRTAADAWCGVVVNQSIDKSLTQAQYNAIASELGSGVANQVVEALEK